VFVELKSPQWNIFPWWNVQQFRSERKGVGMPSRDRWHSVQESIDLKKLQSLHRQEDCQSIVGIPVAVAGVSIDHADKAVQCQSL
jgi:hypothetical protein